MPRSYGAWSARTVRVSRGGLGGRRTPELVAVPVRPHVISVLLVNGLLLLGRLLRCLGRHPITVAVVVAAVWLRLMLGPSMTGWVVLAVAAALSVWWWRWPGSFHRFVGWPVRSRWRRVWRYRRHWQPGLSACGLAGEYGGTQYLPALKTVHAGPFVDQVLVQLLAGQSPARFEDATDQLAHTFGALRCQVRVDRPGRVWLDFYRGDALTEPVRALPVPAVPDFAALPIGITEHGHPWLLRLLGSHVLVAGATGSGKGSVVWSIIRALTRGIRTGTVQLWGVDPKGGMELTFGAPLFSRLAYASTSEMLELLEDAVGAMRHRQRRLLGYTRLHQPSVEDPLIVLVVDELAALIAYVDRETKKRAADALQLLLSQGRAVGVLLVAAVQDPSKDVVAFRDLFPTRIALRMTEDTQVDMVLGRGARDRGAECDRIPHALPGVGYVVLEGVREPVRVRAGHVTDDDLAALTDPAGSADGEADPSLAGFGQWMVTRLNQRPADAA